jgi:hypothetical protein
LQEVYSDQEQGDTVRSKDEYSNWSIVDEMEMAGDIDEDEDEDTAQSNEVSSTALVVINPEGEVDTPLDLTLARQELRAMQEDIAAMFVPPEKDELTPEAEQIAVEEARR